MLSVYSLLVLALILAGLALAWSKRFLAFGSIILANVVVAFVVFLAPEELRLVNTRMGPFPVLESIVRWELSLYGDALAAGEPMAGVQLLSHMFLHGGFMHLVGNMFILAIVGHYLEEEIGPRWFVVTYLLTGVVAAFVQAATSWGEPMRMLGASGAVFGVIGLFGAVAPQRQVRMPVPIGIMVILNLRAWVAAVIFSVAQMLQLALVTSANVVDNTAYMAHLGGLAAGVVVGLALGRFQRRGAAPTTGGAWGAFATTGPAQRAWAHMQESSAEPDVQAVWRQEFLAAARCPRCSSEPRVAGKGLVCTRCGFAGDPAGQTVPDRS